MNKIVKRILIGVGSLLVIGFLAFLWLIPPFTLAPPEAFIEPAQASHQSMDHIEDEALRLRAERGRHLVNTIDCIGCHVPGGEAGPNFSKYLTGGTKWVTPQGSFVARNLTPDPETGLGSHTDAEIKRVLQKGILRDGRQINPRLMPWGMIANNSEEDIDAIVIYLRNIKPVKNKIPDPDPNETSVELTLIVGDFAIE